MCHQLPSASGGSTGSRSRDSSTSVSSNTLSSTDFTRRTFRDDVGTTRRRARRQAGCMAKAERKKSDKPRKAPKLPRDLVAAIRAADDKKAEDLVVLDLEKAAGFTDYFVICSSANARQIRAIADA